MPRRMLQNRSAVRRRSTARRRTVRARSKRDGATGKKIASCPIVGVGGSAGGFEAATELLQHLPAKNGMAFVIVQHLDPHHASKLATLLGRSTHMPVIEVA